MSACSATFYENVGGARACLLTPARRSSISETNVGVAAGIANVGCVVPFRRTSHVEGQWCVPAKGTPAVLPAGPRFRPSVAENA
jgi:hypothetical protein